MDRWEIDELLRRVDLKGLAVEAGAHFQGSKGVSSACPLHGGDNKGAFSLHQNSDGIWTWHCFTRCPEGANGGDAIAFYMRWKKVDFATAVKELAERVGMSIADSTGGGRGGPYGGGPYGGGTSEPEGARLLPATEPPGAQWQARAQAFLAYAQAELWKPSGEAALGYLMLERGLREETISEWGLGFNPKDVYDEPGRWGLEDKKIWLARGIVIPGRRGEVVWYVKIRRPLEGDGLAAALGDGTTEARRAQRRGEEFREIKYAGPRGGRGMLFGVDHMRGLPMALMVEGEFDALMGWQEAGELVDVVTLGGARTRLTVGDAVYLLRARRIVAAYDVDAAGEAGRENLALLSGRVVRARPPAKDVTEMWRAGIDVREWVAGLSREGLLSG